MCKEYLFYDFLEHAFTLKYSLNKYYIKNNMLIIKLSFKDFLKYYNAVLKKLLIDDVLIQFLNRNNLLKLLQDYCIYKVNWQINDYYIYLIQIKGIYHPFDINKLTINEQNAFYGNEAKNALVRSINLTNSKKVV